jgi:hypothetical protein
MELDGPAPSRRESGPEALGQFSWRHPLYYSVGATRSTKDQPVRTEETVGEAK